MPFKLGYSYGTKHTEDRQQQLELDMDEKSSETNGLQICLMCVISSLCLWVIDETREGGEVDDLFMSFDRVF